MTEERIKKYNVLQHTTYIWVIIFCESIQDWYIIHLISSWAIGSTGVRTMSFESFIAGIIIYGIYIIPMVLAVHLAIGLAFWAMLTSREQLLGKPHKTAVNILGAVIYSVLVVGAFYVVSLAGHKIIALMVYVIALGIPIKVYSDLQTEIMNKRKEPLHYERRYY